VGDFSFLKECIERLKEDTCEDSSFSSLRDKLKITFATIESQIFNLEAYVENESRKKILYHERVQELESELFNEKAKVKYLEQNRTNQGDLESFTRKMMERQMLLAETKDLVRETRNACLDLKRIRKIKEKKMHRSRKEDVEETFNGTPVKTLVPWSVAISLETDSTIREALELKEIAFPVYGTEDDEVRGMLTFVDVIVFVKMISGEVTLEEFEPILCSLSLGEQQIASMTVDRIFDVLKCTAYWPVFLNSPLTSLIKTFQRGFNYIPICDEDEFVVNIVTPSMLVKLLSYNLPKLEASMTIGDSTVEELGYLKSSSKYAILSSKAKAIEALFLLHESKAIAIAIVDETRQGKLVGGLSLVDFKDITCDTLPLLFLPILDYIQQHLVKMFILGRRMDPMKRLLQLFVQHKPEHIWIIDDDWQRPIGIVTISDIYNSMEIDWETIGFK